MYVYVLKTNTFWGFINGVGGSYCLIFHEFYMKGLSNCALELKTDAGHEEVQAKEWVEVHGNLAEVAVQLSYMN